MLTELYNFQRCIKRNLPRSVWKEVEDDDWQCLCCNVAPLYELRAQAWASLEYVKANFKDKVKTTISLNLNHLNNNHHGPSGHNSTSTDKIRFAHYFLRVCRMIRAHERGR